MHQNSRRLTPHPAGLPFVVAALFVVLAAFLAAADPCPPSRAAAGSTSPLRGRVAHVVTPDASVQAEPDAGVQAEPGAGAQVGDVREAVSDSIRGVDDGYAEHGETRRKVGGRADKRLPSTAATVLDAPLSFSLRPGAVAPTRRGHAAPPPVVPRAPPVR
jgi:hypothetical protein